MAVYTFTIETEDKNEILGLLKGAVGAPMAKVMTAEETPSAPAKKPGDTTETEAPKKKGGRPPKAKEPEEKESDDADDFGIDEGPTKADVEDRLMAVSRKCGRDAVGAILKKLGAMKTVDGKTKYSVGEIKPEQYAEAVAQADEALQADY